MTDICLGDENILLTVSGIDGSLKSLRKDNKELILPAKRAFSIRLLDEKRNYRHFDSGDFLNFEFLPSSSGSVIRSWINCPELPGMQLISQIVFDGINFRFRNQICNLPENWEFEMIDCPALTVPESNELFWPKTDGVLLDKPEKTERMFQQMDAPSGLSYGFYPGSCQMQFMASYSTENGSGVYFAADDRSHASKLLEFRKETDDDSSRIRLRIECYCGHDGDQHNYELPYDLLLRPFDGDWQDACSIYRDWVKADPSLDNFPETPEWQKKSPVVVVLTVRGNGNINSEENPFSYYENAFPRLKELSEAFDSPVMALLMRWDQHGPWLPPYCWPPAGSLESFLKLRDLLHESGNYFGVYCSGTSFTVKSLMNDYNCEAEFKEKNLAQFMAVSPHGDITDIMPPIREGAHLCITEEFGKSIILEQFRQMAEAGLDYIQFFDQNFGGMNYPCYSENHQHPPQPGLWQTESMSELLLRMTEIARKINPELRIGTESSASLPYLKFLPFSDARSLHNLRYGRPVQGYEFIYHRYSNNFMGNQCAMWDLIDCEKSPDNLLWRIADGFSAGQLFTVTLRADGLISWGAADNWNKAAPDQQNAISLIRSLNKLRKLYPEFLLEGEMQKPFLHIKCADFELPLRESGKVLRYPALSSSFWKASSGKRGAFLVNFRSSPETAEISCAFPFRTGEGIQHAAGKHHISVPGLSAVLIMPES